MLVFLTTDVTVLEYEMYEEVMVAVAITGSGTDLSGRNSPMR